MDNFASQFNQLIAAGEKNIPVVLGIIAGLWAIQIINALTRYRLNHLGLLPRSWRGLPAIIISPLLHAGFEHIFLNSIALFILINLMLLYGMPLFLVVTAFIVLAGGLLVWLFGRRAVHVGASGVIMGYWGYLLVSAYTQGTLMAILIAALVLYYCGGFYMNFFPADKRSSWEGHVFGFFAGIVIAII